MSEMHDIIAKVMAAEAEAKRIVQEAEMSAAKLIQEARNSARTQRDADRNLVTNEANRILTEAAAGAQLTREKLLAEAAATMQREVVLSSASEAEAIDFTLSILTGSA